MRRSRSTVPITIVAMLSITAKVLVAHPRALEAATSANRPDRTFRIGPKALVRLRDYSEVGRVPV
jgi:hypothetical protein